MQIQRLPHSDIAGFSELIRLFAEVFGMKNFKVPPRDHLQELMSDKNFLVFVALENNKVIGGLTVYVLQRYYSTKPHAFLYDLAVDTEHQRQGIGKKLIASVNAYCKSQGIEEVFVQAESADQHAVSFYRGTPVAKECAVIQFTYNTGR